MHCVQCAQPIDPDNVVAALVRCGACGHVFDLAGAVSAVPPPLPPPGVSVRRYAEGVALDLPWSGDLSVPGIALQLFFAAIPLAVGWSSWRMLPLAVPASAFLLYNLLTNLVNRTTVSIGGGSVDVSHGPLPTMWNRSVTLPLARLRGVRVERVVSVSAKGPETTKYQLESPGSGGPLLKDWNTPETLDFVQETLQSAVALGGVETRP
jgi:hypothetical protein